MSESLEAGAPFRSSPRSTDNTPSTLQEEPYQDKQLDRMLGTDSTILSILCGAASNTKPSNGSSQEGEQDLRSLVLMLCKDVSILKTEMETLKKHNIGMATKLVSVGSELVEITGMLKDIKQSMAIYIRSSSGAQGNPTAGLDASGIHQTLGSNWGSPSRNYELVDPPRQSVIKAKNTREGLKNVLIDTVIVLYRNHIGYETVCSIGRYQLNYIYDLCMDIPLPIRQQAGDQCQGVEILNSDLSEVASLYIAMDNGKYWEYLITFMKFLKKHFYPCIPKTLYLMISNNEFRLERSPALIIKTSARGVTAAPGITGKISVESITKDRAKAKVVEGAQWKIYSFNPESLWNSIVNNTYTSDGAYTTMVTSSGALRNGGAQRLVMQDSPAAGSRVQNTFDSTRGQEQTLLEVRQVPIAVSPPSRRKTPVNANK